MRGATVTVFDPEPARGAGWAAGGMISPEFETQSTAGQLPALSELAFASRALWDAFAFDLGLELGPPSIAIEVQNPAASQANMPEKRILWRDTFVDPRKLSASLWESCCRAGVHFERTGVRQLGGTETEVVLWDGQTKKADTIIVAAGSAARYFASDLPELKVIFPIKGILTSVHSPGALDTVIRSASLYLIPRGDQVVIGATSEPGVDDLSVPPEAVQQLLRGAVRLVPSLKGKLPVESWAGVRPGSPDHAPLVGWSSRKGVYIAAGWHRNGILLAPVAADIIANEVLGGIEDPSASAFRPNRFG